jgi:hypothetical protein
MAMSAFTSTAGIYPDGEKVRFVPTSAIRTAANGNDARTTDHDPVKLFRWNKPTKQRRLVDEIAFIVPRKPPETDA